MTITKTYTLSIRDFVHNLSEQEFSELRDAVNSAAIPAQGKPLSPPSYPHQIRIPCQNGSYAILTTTDPNAELTIPASCGIESEQGPDPYADLRKAQSEGKTLQLALTAGGWGDWEGEPSDDFPPYRYRVKPEEPTEPKAEGPGWIPWNGGECPVLEGTLIDVKYRDGEVKTAMRALIPADGRDTTAEFWKRHGFYNDIIAYRIHKP